MPEQIEAAEVLERIGAEAEVPEQTSAEKVFWEIGARKMPG